MKFTKELYIEYLSAMLNVEEQHYNNGEYVSSEKEHSDYIIKLLKEFNNEIIENLD